MVRLRRRLQPQDGTAAFDVTFLFSLSVHSSVRMPAIDMLKAGDHEDLSSSSTTRRPPSFSRPQRALLSLRQGGSTLTISSGCVVLLALCLSLSPPTSLNPPHRSSVPTQASSGKGAAAALWCWSAQSVGISVSSLLDLHVWCGTHWCHGDSRYS